VQYTRGSDVVSLSYTSAVITTKKGVGCPSLAALEERLAVELDALGNRPAGRSAWWFVKRAVPCPEGPQVR